MDVIEPHLSAATEVTPEKTLEATPEVTPGTTPEAAPEVEHEATPEAATETTAEATPEAAPQSDESVPDASNDPGDFRGGRRARRIPTRVFLANAMEEIRKLDFNKI